MHPDIFSSLDVYYIATSVGYSTTGILMKGLISLYASMPTYLNFHISIESHFKFILGIFSKNPLKGLLEE